AVDHQKPWDTVHRACPGQHRAQGRDVSRRGTQQLAALVIEAPDPRLLLAQPMSRQVVLGPLESEDHAVVAARRAGPLHALCFGMVNPNPCSAFLSAAARKAANG